MRASLEALRTQLTSGTGVDDFNRLMATFHDLIEADPRLLEESEPCGLPDVLRVTLQEVAAQVCRPGAVLAEAWLLRHGPEQLVHGTVVLGGRAATVLYFERASVGLVTVAIGRGEVLSSRFRVLGTPRDAELN